MKLTFASKYALHAVAYMATQKTDKPVASHNIAKDRGVPERFLLKVLKPLVTHRVLTSVKGPNGGYRLARPASQISILEIIEAVDGRIQSQVPLRVYTDKKTKTEWKEDETAPLHVRLTVICTQTADQVRKLLEKIKLSELVKA